MDAAVLTELGTPVLRQLRRAHRGRRPGGGRRGRRGTEPRGPDHGRRALSRAHTPDFPSVPGPRGHRARGRPPRVLHRHASRSGRWPRARWPRRPTCTTCPTRVDDGTAVALGIAGLAAWLPLAWRAKVQEGETVLVMGATGVLGSIAVQAAKLLGAGRVVGAGRDAEGPRARRAPGRRRHRGPDALPTTRPPPTWRRAGGEGPDVILDPVWGEPGAAAMRSLAPFGRHVQIGNSADPELTLMAPGVPQQHEPGHGLHQLPRAAGRQGRGVRHHGRPRRGRADRGGRGADPAGGRGSRRGSARPAFAHRKLVLVP